MVVWKIRNYKMQKYLSLMGPLSTYFIWDDDGDVWSSYKEVKEFIDSKVIENAELVQYKITEISRKKIERKEV